MEVEKSYIKYFFGALYSSSEVMKQEIRRDKGNPEEESWQTNLSDDRREFRGSAELGHRR